MGSLSAGCAAERADSAEDADASSNRSAQTDANATRDAAVDAQTDACIVTSAASTWRVTWDAAKRVMSQHASVAEDSAVKLAWRYDAAGRLVAYAGFGPGTYDNFQQDLQYDDGGNRKDFQLSYPSTPI